ncbi:MAG TPA: hypothetical protein VFQ85_01485 [Mycobacteriales bacterium]|jgi:plastocyanin|nr:hypothetical protein [Mycobacteriales bacterium]
MPDLTDDLRALLRDRAEEAPAVPAVTDALVRTVRRRRATRATLAVAGCAVAVAGVAGVALAVRSRPVAEPARPPVPVTVVPDAGCPANGSVTIVVKTSRDVTEFDDDCYATVAGVPAHLSFANNSALPHNVAVDVVPGRTVAVTRVLGRGGDRTDTVDLGRLPAGEYTLYCQVHPQMRARLIAR